MDWALFAVHRGQEHAGQHQSLDVPNLWVSCLCTGAYTSPDQELEVANKRFGVGGVDLGY